MSTEDLEVEVKGEDEKDEKRHRSVSEWERGYRIGFNKGRANVWHQLGVRPSEIKAGKVKITIGDREDILKLGDESVDNEPEKREVRKKEGDRVPIIVGVVVAIILGLLVYYFVFGKRNQPSN